jgi:3-deoxy-manno-octulosonate cytidylyltransferase (CMP-KDO synthetase)
MASALIIIPARMQASRLPGKPLADINGEPMIVHVWRRVMKAEAGRVVVATDSDAIFEVVRAVGGEAVLTRPDHASGTDRVFEAASRLDPDRDIDVIVNVQGDMPTLDPKLVPACIEPLAIPLKEGGPHIATIAAQITDPALRKDPSVVKAVGTPVKGTNRLRAMYFTRAEAPYGEGPLYHHEGLYAYRRTALERFVSLPPSTLELREGLEQLRALEDGMRIDIVLVDRVPLGVNTPDDLEAARRVFDTHKRAGS